MAFFYSTHSPLILRAFFDVDWVGDPTDCRSTTSYCFFLGSSLISWQSKKQTHMARLVLLCKVEFIQPSNWLYSVPNLLVFSI